MKRKYEDFSTSQQLVKQWAPVATDLRKHLGRPATGHHALRAGCGAGQMYPPWEAQGGCWTPGDRQDAVHSIFSLKMYLFLKYEDIFKKCLLHYFSINKHALD